MAFSSTNLSRLSRLRPASFICDNHLKNTLPEKFAFFCKPVSVETRYNLSTATLPNELPPPAKFIKLSEGTPEDFKITQDIFSKVASTENTVNRWISMVEVRMP